MNDEEARQEQRAASIRRYIQLATALAARHDEVTAAHLVAALLQQEEVRRAIAACGPDPEEVAEVAAGTVDEIAQRRWWQLGPGISADLFAIVDRAMRHAQGAELDVIPPTTLLVHVLAEVPQSVIVGRIDAMGVERLPLTLMAEHGDPRDHPFPAGTGRARVMVHNDSFTTKEHVMALLMECFDHPEEEAVRLVEKIHRGSDAAAVFTDEWDRACERAETARGHARAAGFPLRVTVSPDRL